MTMHQKLRAWTDTVATQGRCRWCRRALGRCACPVWEPPRKVKK